LFAACYAIMIWTGTFPSPSAPAVLQLSSFIERAATSTASPMSTILVSLTYLERVPSFAHLSATGHPACWSRLRHSIASYAAGRGLTALDAAGAQQAESLAAGKCLWTGAFILADAYMNDNAFACRSWQEVTEIPAVTCSLLKNCFLQGLGHSLHVPVDLYVRWIEKLRGFLLASPDAGASPQRDMIESLGSALAAAAVSARVSSIGPCAPGVVDGLTVGIPDKTFSTSSPSSSSGSLRQASPPPLLTLGSIDLMRSRSTGSLAASASSPSSDSGVGISYLSNPYPSRLVVGALSSSLPSSPAANFLGPAHRAQFRLLSAGSIQPRSHLSVAHAHQHLPASASPRDAYWAKLGSSPRHHHFHAHHTPTIPSAATPMAVVSTLSSPESIIHGVRSDGRVHKSAISQQLVLHSKGLATPEFFSSLGPASEIELSQLLCMPPLQQARQDAMRQLAVHVIPAETSPVQEQQQQQQHPHPQMWADGEVFELPQGGGNPLLALVPLAPSPGPLFDIAADLGLQLEPSVAPTSTLLDSQALPTQMMQQQQQQRQLQKIQLFQQLQHQQRLQRQKQLLIEALRQRRIRALAAEVERRRAAAEQQRQLQAQAQVLRQLQLEQLLQLQDAGDAAARLRQQQEKLQQQLRREQEQMAQMAQLLQLPNAAATAAWSGLL
ncbi:hypothetical protein HK405_005205, partial [Cladochytrium tenue]